MNRKSVSRLLFVSAFVFFTAPSLFAQIGGTGSIQGIITDATGAVIPGATVTATNAATGVKTERQTTGAGLYVLSPLAPGEYKISVMATGFRQLEQDKVVVDALTTVGLNLTLQVGASTETVTVTAAPTQLNTSDARLGTTIRNELYTNLPLAMGTAVAGSGIGQGPRNPGAFIFLLPGVTEGNRWGQINGAQGFSKDVFIEGVPITDPIQQGEGRTIALGVSVEAVEQFQVETSGTGVEFNGQGSENYTIKSGKKPVSRLGIRIPAKYRPGCQGLLPDDSSGRASKRIWCHSWRPDHQEEGSSSSAPTTDGVIALPARRSSFRYRR